MHCTFGDAKSSPFSLLPASHTPWQRWVCSGCVHIALIGALVLVPMEMQEPRAEPHPISRVTLNSPPPIKPFHPVPIRIRLPAPKTAVLQLVAISLIIPEQKPPSARKQPMEPVVQKRKVEVTMIEPPQLELTVPAPSASLAVSHMSPAPAIKVGGFGDPVGVLPTRPPQTSAVTLDQAGRFDTPAGKGDGSRFSSGKGLAMAGFGNGGGSDYGHGPGGRGTGVKSAGFGNADGGAQVTRVGGLSAPVDTPVNVIWKPRPVYTAEAREKKIEGEVQLEVVFGANGQISVLRLLGGLGYGLDENARMAASQIRFHPGTRHGNPIDTKATVHIQFELS